MKLKEFLENLNKLVEENPECLEMDVVYSIDDEGNAFRKIHFEPSKGIFEDMDFIPEDNIEEHERDKSEINSICIN